jgi:hypothetical protein
MKFAVLVVALFALPSFAGDSKQCKKDCKEFIEQCEKGCDSSLKKKDPKGKLTQGCKKNCSDFVKQCEKGCDSGQF